MGVRAETAPGMPDTVKWLVVVAIMAAAVAGFYYFGDESLLLRVIGILLAGGASAAVALQTEKGRVGWDFVKESRMELRKVVWPTQRETLQTTGIVMVVVAVAAVVLWLLDSLFGWLIQLLLRGG